MKATKVPEDYTPDIRIYRLCEEKGIPEEFMLGEVQSFIFHWQEKGIRRKSWHKSFLNWVKNGWRWKQERAKKQAKTNPSANVEWQGEQIKVSKSRPNGMTLKQMIKDSL